MVERSAHSRSLVGSPLPGPSVLISSGLLVHIEGLGMEMNVKKSVFGRQRRTTGLGADSIAEHTWGEPPVQGLSPVQHLFRRYGARGLAIPNFIRVGAYVIRLISLLLKPASTISEAQDPVPLHAQDRPTEVSLLGNRFGTSDGLGKGFR